MRYCLLFLLLSLSLYSEAQFTQVVHGIELTGLPVGHTSGVSWYDFDHDGWDDLTVGQGNDAILVLRNINGTLTLVHVFPNTTQVKSFQWVDYDNDGDSDFFVCAVNASCKLFRNDGNLIFTDVTANLSLLASGEDSMGASWADYDRDGWLDVYVCNYYGQNWLLHNRGDGTFENVGLQLGVANSNRPTYMCSWVDYNNDCLLDLFVANDLGQLSEMYQNTGDGFVAVGEAIGLDLTIEAMGVCWADYDNDLDLDLYVTNAPSGNRLMRNDNGIFTDVAFSAGVAVQALSWGCMWFDYDHDTREDLHVGTQAPLVNQNINFLLKQQSDQTFANVSMPADAGNCFATAKGDLNNDGYWDFCDAFVLPARFLVWQNNGGSNNWIKLHLNATTGNADAIGSKIYYSHGGQEYYKHTFCGESFFGQDSQYEILSLGASTVVDSVRIEWPSGRRDTFYNLAMNELHTLTEGSTSLLSIEASKQVLCSGEDVIQLSVEGASNYNWSNGSTEPSITINEPGDYWVKVESGCNAIDSLSINIQQLEAPEVTEIAQSPSCAGYDDGCIGVLLDGVEPDQLTFQELSSGINLCAVLAGTYTYEAIDVNGCSSVGEIALQNPEPVVVTSQSVSICGNTTAQAELNATGGSGAYVFSVQGADMNNLQPGEYVGVATDENGCVGSVNFTIQAFPAVNFFATADSICFGELASLQYFGSGGTLPYTYDWQGQNPNALASGFYEFTLTDGNGCSDVVNIQVVEFPFLDAQISMFTNANNGANGSMELSISGGEMPYEILWNTGDTDEVLDSIGQGTYAVTVTDANGCVGTDSQSIIDLDITELETQWSVYPNPTADYVQLIGITNGNYTLCDLDGRLLRTGSVRVGNNLVDLSRYPNGTYVLTIEREGSIITKRVTKL
ncbi:MAG: FG-GAP-like repeat-containing protein [Flavobacteriales bacterium]